MLLLESIGDRNNIPAKSRYEPERSIPVLIKVMPKKKRLVGRIIRWTVLIILAVLVLPAMLFVINGLWLRHGETPVIGGAKIDAPSNAAPTANSSEPSSTVKVLSYNIAKAFAVDENLDSPPREEVYERLQRVADIINAEQPDIVFFSEILLECCFSRINQISELQKLTELKHWAFGENFNIGLPWLRVVSGNAILSRWPLAAVGNPDLPGRKPFYVVKNNRRVLMCSIDTLGEPLTLVACHNNTYNKDVNHQQVQTILASVAETPALLAGDFNARPDSPSIAEIRTSNRFNGAFNGPPTFPSTGPSRTIDYIFAPAHWELLDHRTICDEASDHCAIVSTFKLPTTR